MSKTAAISLVRTGLSLAFTAEDGQLQDHTLATVAAHCGGKVGQNNTIIVAGESVSMVRDGWRDLANKDSDTKGQWYINEPGES